MVYLCAHHTSAVGTFFLPHLEAIWGALALPMLRQVDHSFFFENMVYLCAPVGTFFLPDLVAIWGAQ